MSLFFQNVEAVDEQTQKNSKEIEAMQQIVHDAGKILILKA